MKHTTLFSFIIEIIAFQHKTWERQKLWPFATFDACAKRMRNCWLRSRGLLLTEILQNVSSTRSGLRTCLVFTPRGTIDLATVSEVDLAQFNMAAGGELWNCVVFGHRQRFPEIRPSKLTISSNIQVSRMRWFEHLNFQSSHDLTWHTRRMISFRKWIKMNEFGILDLIDLVE